MTNVSFVLDSCNFIANFFKVPDRLYNNKEYFSCNCPIAIVLCSKIERNKVHFLF